MSEGEGEGEGERERERRERKFSSSLQPYLSLFALIPFFAPAKHVSPHGQDCCAGHPDSQGVELGITQSNSETPDLTPWLQDRSNSLISFVQRVYP